MYSTNVVQCLAHSRGAQGPILGRSDLSSAPRDHILAPPALGLSILFDYITSQRRAIHTSRWNRALLCNLFQDRCLFTFYRIVECKASGSKWSLLGSRFSEQGALPRWRGQSRWQVQPERSVVALRWAPLLVQGDALVSPAVGREMSGC